jgi:hypothetical protein
MTAGLLDQVPGAVAAYSLRKLSNAYAGQAVNVRRSSDNATQDISFTGNDFNSGNFSNFVGASTGFVATWYDQAGSANATAIGGLTANQPAIAYGTPRSRAVVSVTATTQGMIAVAAANTAVVSFAMVSNRTGSQTTYGVIISYDGNCPGLAYNNSADTGFTVGNVGVGILSPAPATDIVFHSVVGVMNGAGTFVEVDNGTPVTGNLIGATGSSQIDLCNRSGFAFIGNVAEAIIWNRALSAAEIAQLTADHRNYYGTP